VNASGQIGCASAADRPNRKGEIGRTDGKARTIRNHRTQRKDRVR